jgi:hypothetical protein
MKVSAALVCNSVLSGLLFASGLSGCAVSSLDVPTYDEFAIEMRIGATPNGKGAYEQYKLLPAGIFIECGEMQSGVSQTKQFGVFPIADATRAGISLLASGVLSGAGAVSDTVTGPIPGGAVTMSFIVDGERHDIREPINALLKGGTEHEDRVRELVEVMRGTLQQPLCGRREFMALSRRKVMAQLVEE